MWKLFRLLCIPFVVFPTRVSAWWCEGHMVIAEIARQQIEKAKTDDSVKDRLDDLIALLSSVTDDKHQSDTFTTAACWADDLEAHKLGAMASWHYINQVYNPDNVVVPPYFDSLQPDGSMDDLPMNTVPWAVAQMKRTVRQCDLQINCTGPGKFEVAFALRMLIHFVGDLHQPLHCVDRFAPNFTKGDDGGNKVMVEVDGQTMSLHGYWDSAAGLLDDHLTRPLDRSSRDKIVQHAKAIMAKYPLDGIATGHMGNLAGDILQWVNESYIFATKMGYYNISMDPTVTTKLSSKYEAAARVLTEKRLAIAGYRLGVMLGDFSVAPNDGEETKPHGFLGYCRYIWKHYREYCIALGAFITGLWLAEIFRCCAFASVKKRKPLEPRAQHRAHPSYREEQLNSPLLSGQMNTDPPDS